MTGQGFSAWWPAETLAVMGFSDALKRYRELSGIRSALKKRLLTDPPDVFIGIDAGLQPRSGGRSQGARYSDRALCQPVDLGLAWRSYQKIRRAVSHILALFPFEPAIYEAGRGTGELCRSSAGRPVADTPGSRCDARAAGLAFKRTGVRAAAGESSGELRFLADTFIDAARLVHERLRESRFLVPLATRETRLMFEEAIYRCKAHDLPLKMLFGHAQDAMIAADGVLVASGTATLEAALLKRPMVIAYPSWRRFAFPHEAHGLPALRRFAQHSGGRFVVPEFIRTRQRPRSLPRRCWRSTPTSPAGGDRRRVRTHSSRAAAEHSRTRSGSGDLLSAAAA